MICKICGQELTKDSVHIHLSEARKQQDGGLLSMEEALGTDEPMPVSFDDDEKDY